MSQRFRFEPDIRLRSQPVRVALFREQPLGEVHALLELGDAMLHRLDALTQLGDLRAVGVRLLQKAATEARGSARDRASYLDGDENDRRAKRPAGNNEREHVLRLL